MSQKFNELGYHLPPEAPETYAATAVNVLSDVIDASPAAAANVMEPSSVLLFGGLRGISPYHELSANVSPSERKSLDQTLGKHGVHRIGDTDTNHFSLISENGVQDVRNRYEATDYWTLPNGYDANTLTEWLDMTARDIHKELENSHLPPEWRRDPQYTAQNLQFGMLLGYPGKAVSSAMWAAANGDPSGTTLSPVVISDGMPYHGAEVAYDVDPLLVDSAEIRSHRKLWTEVIRIVYEQLQFEELMKNERFASAYEQIPR